MNFATIIVTRSKSCHVRTLHNMLRLNMRCYERGMMNTIIYTNDDPFEKAEKIHDAMKKYDRILFIDFGICMDDASIVQVLEKHEMCGVLVFPAVNEGIDWDMFKEKVKSNTQEPLEQMGLYFDTDVGKELSEDVHLVKKTSARCWMMNCKNVLKHMKDKKTGEYKINPKRALMFEKMQHDGVRIIAYTPAKLTMLYAHECLGNIMNCAGVKVN